MSLWTNVQKREVNCPTVGRTLVFELVVDHWALVSSPVSAARLLLLLLFPDHKALAGCRQCHWEGMGLPAPRQLPFSLWGSLKSCSSLGKMIFFFQKQTCIYLLFPVFCLLFCTTAFFLKEESFLNVHWLPVVIPSPEAIILPLALVTLAILYLFYI